MEFKKIVFNEDLEGYLFHTSVTIASMKINDKVPYWENGPSLTLWRSVDKLVTIANDREE